MKRLLVFVFTRDPNSLGFNSSSHILLGLELGEARGISAIIARFYHSITPGILTCKLQPGTAAGEMLVLIKFGFSLLRVQERKDKDNHSKGKIQAGYQDNYRKDYRG